LPKRPKAGQKFSRLEIFRELRPEFPGMGSEQQKKLQTKNQTKRNDIHEHTDENTYVSVPTRGGPVHFHKGCLRNIWELENGTRDTPAGDQTSVQSEGDQGGLLAIRAVEATVLEETGMC
jgi:hypothetical protein